MLITNFSFSLLFTFLGTHCASFKFLFFNNRWGVWKSFQYVCDWKDFLMWTGFCYIISLFPFSIVFFFHLLCVSFFLKSNFSNFCSHPIFAFYVILFFFSICAAEASTLCNSLLYYYDDDFPLVDSFANITSGLNFFNAWTLDSALICPRINFIVHLHVF